MRIDELVAFGSTHGRERHRRHATDLDHQHRDPDLNIYGLILVIFRPWMPIPPMRPFCPKMKA
jgi:hypothetical protein